MPMTSDIDLNEVSQVILLQGPPGCGKTWLLQTFPPPVYVFDFDGGVSTLRHAEGIEYDTYVDGPSPTPPTAWHAFVHMLNNFVMQKEDREQKGTLAIDSLSSLMFMLQHYVMQHSKQKNAWARPSLPDWGTIISHIQELFMEFRCLNMTIVLTCHEQQTMDEVERTHLITPNVSGKALPSDIPKWCDGVYRLEVTQGAKGELSRVLRTTSTSRVNCKTKLLGLEPLEEPNYLALLEKNRRAEAKLKQAKEKAND